MSDESDIRKPREGDKLWRVTWIRAIGESFVYAKDEHDAFLRANEDEAFGYHVAEDEYGTDFEVEERTPEEEADDLKYLEDNGYMDEDGGPV